MGDLKYKVGDKVRIKSLDWYNENKNHCGEIPLFKPSGLFVPDMSRYCNNIMTIKDICYGTCYRMKEDFWHYNWTDEMIEGLVEEDVDLIPKFGEFSDNEPLDIPTMTTDFIKEHGFPRPEGYIFKDENGNVINAKKIVLEKKKKEYPKTYTECSDILSVYTDPDISGYKGELLWAFQKLLVCRDAYWKLYGEEKGLGKPWEPDWNCNEYKYGIQVYENKVEYVMATHTQIAFPMPTEEMRDAFKENFDPDLEICKEFL